MPKFNEDDNKKIDKQINLNIRDMTKKIKECEDNIRHISLERIIAFQETKSKIELYIIFQSGII